jgi:para-nitrobenzyl esterase
MKIARLSPGRFRPFGHACAAMVACIALLSGAGRANATVSTTVGTARGGVTVIAPVGRIVGTSLDGMRAFRGIRYAAPPVGALRWQPPAPLVETSASAATSTIQATQFGNHCPQNAGAFGEGSVSEDCLFLNVFAPARVPSFGRLPVMVWIHGGAFTTGESDDYNPDRFVSNGVVVVTLNYRLGLLGFFAHPALDGTAQPAVNYGLLDQQAALKWVARNVAAFGGDPHRVTIFGESAGGLSVFSQLASPLATGLFSGALIESGAYQLALPTLAQSEAAGTQTAAALGCTSQSAACLRAVPVAQILATEGPMTVPTVDGRVLPASPGTAFSTGAFNRVPILDGSNHDEYRLFVAADFDLQGAPITAAEYPLLIDASLGTAAGSATLARYPLADYASPDVAFATVVTDYIFACPALGADIALQKRVPLFAYEFADENAPEPYLPPVSFPYAAAHASEIQYIWDSFAKPNPPLTNAQRRLGNQMVDFWTAFATTRQPNGFATPAWFPFVPTFDDLEELVPPRPAMGVGFATDHKCAFWQSLANASTSGATIATIRAAARHLRVTRTTGIGL